MMMIPISTKFAARGTPVNAPHVTFTCVQVACVNILVSLRFPSSPEFIFMCSLPHETQIYWFQYKFFDTFQLHNFGIEHACFCRWVVFWGMTGINTIMVGAVSVLCAHYVRAMQKCPPLGGRAFKGLVHKLPKQFSTLYS